MFGGPESVTLWVTHQVAILIRATGIFWIPTGFAQQTARAERSSEQTLWIVLDLDVKQEEEALRRRKWRRLNRRKSILHSGIDEEAFRCSRASAVEDPKIVEIVYLFKEGLIAILCAHRYGGFILKRLSCAASRLHSIGVMCALLKFRAVMPGLTPSAHSNCIPIQCVLRFLNQEIKNWVLTWNTDVLKEWSHKFINNLQFDLLNLHFSFGKRQMYSNLIGNLCFLNDSLAYLDTVTIVTVIYILQSKVWTKEKA